MKGIINVYESTECSLQASAKVLGKTLVVCSGILRAGELNVFVATLPENVDPAGGVTIAFGP